jgi:myo-inositol-1(or 4)-monophosphatase
MTLLERKYQKLMEFMRTVGKMQLDYFRKNNFKFEEKLNIYDLVTEVDKKSEELLVDFIAKEFPDDDIVGEEFGTKDKKSLSQAELQTKKLSKNTWFIDPIDGTTNFVTGLPQFAISVGLETPLKDHCAGFVYAPYLNEFFYAQRGYGAYLNGEKIQIKKKAPLNKSVWATGFPYDKLTHPLNNIDFCAFLIPKVRDVRRLGAASLDICYVALGVLDGYWELNLKKWDVAAGQIILEEAQGVLKYLPLKDRPFSFVTGHHEHVEFLSSEFMNFYQNLIS